MKHEDFRFQLREESLADHDRVDFIFSTYDLQTRSGFLAFAYPHLDSFQTMLSVAPPHSWSCELLPEMIDGLLADLVVLDAPNDQPAQSMLPCVHPLALDYMVTGSRLGAAVLRNRWLGATDPTVRQASHYFSLDKHIQAWRATCLSLSGIDPTGKDASRITKDTRLLFKMFADAASKSETISPMEKFA